MKRVRCPKCDHYIPFDETKYTTGQKLIFQCPDCGKEFGIRLGVSKLRNAQKDENPDEIDEYTLTTEGNHQDLNQLYFIFSPQKFSKALDRFKNSSDGTLFPRMLSWEDFQKWILKARRADKDMCVQTKYITISPRK